MVFEALSDEDIIARVIGGDSGALSVLYDRHGPVMLAVGCRLLRSQSEAEDLLHDVFMEAWRRIDTFDRSRGTVRGWLILRMRSRALDRLRSPRKKRLAHGDGAIAKSREVVVEPPALPRLVEEKSRLYAAVCALSAEHQAVVICVYFDGLTLAETAARLSVPTGTVKSRLFIARKRMRETMEGERARV